MEVLWRFAGFCAKCGYVVDSIFLLFSASFVFSGGSVV